MKFRILSSGSSGNCYCIEHNNKYIFIDAGVSVKRIKEELGDLPDDSEKMLFITHEHSDHISGFMPLVKKYAPKVYTSEKTAFILVEKGANPDNIYVLDADCNYDMEDFSVTPFKLMHDAVEPFGYKFCFDDNIISIATDFGIVTDYITKSIEDSNIVLLESNYEDEILKANNYPAYLKSRILSNRGHLSNMQAHKLIGELSSKKLQKCFLAHVSENSNDYNLLERYAINCQEYYNVETMVVYQKKPIVVNIT